MPWPNPARGPLRRCSHPGLSWNLYDEPPSSPSVLPVGDKPGIGAKCRSDRALPTATPAGKLGQREAERRVSEDHGEVVGEGEIVTHSASKHAVRQTGTDARLQGEGQPWARI